jgi:hypothetical protein
MRTRIWTVTAHIRILSDSSRSYLLVSEARGHAVAQMVVSEMLEYNLSPLSLHYIESSLH